MTGAAWLGAALVSLGALAFAVGRWLAERRSVHLRRLWERAVLDREAHASRADDERRLRVAAVDHMEAYAAQVQEGKAEIAALRAERDELRAKVQQGAARALMAWREADHLEALLNTAEDELDDARRELRQAQDLADELREGTEPNLAEEVIAARVAVWRVEDQGRRYQARLARRAAINSASRGAASPVHGPKGGQCEELDEKKTVLQDGSADV